jgi:transcription antitermination factor NusG
MGAAGSSSGMGTRIPGVNPAAPCADPFLPQRMPDIPDRSAWGLVQISAAKAIRYLQAMAMLEAGILFWRPLVMRFSWHRDGISNYRRRTTLRPLFPSYLFCAYDPDHSDLDALRVPDGFGRFIHVGWGGQEQFVSELRELDRALAVGQPLGRPTTMLPGMICRVTGGPFVGVIGILETTGDRPRFVLRVSTMSQSVPLEVDRSLLEPFNA